MTDIQIAAEAPGADDIQALLAERDAYFDELYAVEDRNAKAVDLESGGLKFFAARRDGALVGCGAVIFQTGYAELKRFYVRPGFRGQGLGRRLVEALQQEALRHGHSTLRLETGVLQPDAIALYRSAGFRDIEAFGEYQPDPLSLFMETRL